MCVWKGVLPPPLRPNIMVGARLLHAVPGLTAVHQAVGSCCAALDKLLVKLSAVLVELLISCSLLSAAELCSSCLNQIIAARTHTQPRSQGLENIPEKLKHSLLPKIVKACVPLLPHSLSPPCLWFPPEKKDQGNTEEDIEQDSRERT